jgi:hypothetical protein
MLLFDIGHQLGLTDDPWRSSPAALFDENWYESIP